MPDAGVNTVDAFKVTGIEIMNQSRHSRRTVRTNRSAIPFACGI